MILVWFRRDLRTLDHTALKAALDSGSLLLPVLLQRQSNGKNTTWHPCRRISLHDV